MPFIDKLSHDTYGVRFRSGYGQLILVAPYGVWPRPVSLLPPGGSVPRGRSGHREEARVVVLRVLFRSIDLTWPVKGQG